MSVTGTEVSKKKIWLVSKIRGKRIKLLLTQSAGSRGKGGNYGNNRRIVKSFRRIIYPTEQIVGKGKFGMWADSWRGGKGNWRSAV